VIGDADPQNGVAGGAPPSPSGHALHSPTEVIRVTSPDPAGQEALRSQGRRLRPFGVGVLAVPPGWDDVDLREERLAVAMTAYDLGHFLLDTIEIPPDLEGADEAYASVWELVDRAAAQALFVRGPIDRTVLDPMAMHLRLIVREADGPLVEALTSDPSEGGNR
jgi:hypothetical protein